MSDILVIAPHPDDESIGCGGTLRLHATRGDCVRVVFLTSGEQGLPTLPSDEARRIREREAENAAAVLGLSGVTFLRRPDGSVGEHVADIVPLIRQHLACSTIYVPHDGESHPDHRAAAEILRLALSGWTRCRFYEVWTPLPSFDVVEDISTVMEDKLKAIRCHASQVADIPYDRAIAGLNQYRGLMTVRSAFAEVFRSVD
jgi:LmbE family N-acetylglucosaminyl deacetylase